MAPKSPRQRKENKSKWVIYKNKNKLQTQSETETAFVNRYSIIVYISYSYCCYYLWILRFASLLIQQLLSLAIEIDVSGGFLLVN